MHALAGSDAFGLSLMVTAALAMLSIGLFMFCQMRSTGRSAFAGIGVFWIRMTALAVAYFATAAFGLHWAMIEGSASLVWPAAGVGLAGLLLGGVELWPAIFAGRLLAALLLGSTQPLWADIMIAGGNAGSTALAAWVVLRWLPIDRRLTSVRDVMVLSSAAVLSGAVAAAVGAAALAWAGQAAASLFELWLGWGLGNSAGALLLAPVILVWSYRSAWQLTAQRWFTLLALLAGTCALCFAIFFDRALWFLSTWFVYPMLIWIAVSFQVRGASLALLFVTVIVTWSATLGLGPLGVGTFIGQITLAQQFTAVTAFSTLVVAAAADQRLGVEALRQTQARESSIVNTAVDPIIVIDDRARIVSFNPAAERTFGYRAEEVTGKNVKLLMPEPHRSAHDGYMERYHRTGVRRIIGIGRRVEGRRADGSVFPLDLSVAEWWSGDTVFYTGIIHEQTERAAAEAETREMARRLATAVEATGGGIYERAVHAVDGVHVSPEWLAILGYDELPVRPERFDEWLFKQVHPDDREARQAAWQEFIEGRAEKYEEEVRKRHLSGKWVWVRSYAQATERDEAGGVRRLSGIMLDITEKKLSETRVEHLARHDVLTGLSNRVVFSEQMAAAIERADKAGACAGLVMIDLDNFKSINDTLGHMVGDEVLRIVTDRITGSIRDGDTAARLGGDEFAVVVPQVRTREDVVDLARRLHATNSAPAAVEGREIPLSVSVGFAVYPSDAEGVDQLMRHADLALYEAKRLGRDQVHAFRPQLAAAAVQRSRIEEQLRRALDENALELHYQPQVDLGTGRVRGVEALVRWPRNGATLSPEEFIPIAESSGAIRPLGRWVLREAARQQALWRAQGYDVTMAVNVSPAEASSEGFIPALRETLEEVRLPGHALELEITEGLLIDPDRPSVRTFLDGCQENGIGLAIDDFGMGFSSLSYLAHLPISKVKIDRSFIGRVDEERRSPLVETIVKLGHQLDKNVVAEGVETRHQLDYLREIGCDHAQGFLLFRPDTAEAVTRVLDHDAGAPGVLH